LFAVHLVIIFWGNLADTRKVLYIKKKTPALVYYLCNFNVWVIWALGVWPSILIFFRRFGHIAIVRAKNHEEDILQYVDVGSGSKGEDLMWVLS